MTGPSERGSSPDGTSTGGRLAVSDPARLSQMLVMSEVDYPWQPEELQSVLLHQLAAPIALDLPGVVPPPGEGAPADAGIQSVGELLHHPHPPLQLLQALKEFAKANALHPQSVLPREIANVLYCSAIVVSLARCGRRITAMDDAALVENVKSALSCGWLDENTRAVLTDGLGRLNSAEGGT